MDWTSVLSGAVGVAIITGVFKLAEWYLKRKAQKEDRQEDRENTLKDNAQRKADFDKEQNDKLEAIQSQLETLNKTVEGLQKAERYGLRMEIERRAQKCIEKKGRTPKEFEILTTQHNIYHNDLNGNGYLDDVMAAVKELPFI